jgi:cell wall-associated NlpC family hydrolase
MAIANKKRVTRTTLIASLAAAAVLAPAGIASAAFEATTPEVKPAVMTVERNSHAGQAHEVEWVKPISMGQHVVNAALTQLGSAYVFGGTQPGGFDCSGLVQWAHTQAGISIPRTSDAQWAAGVPVSLDALQPGDIIVMNGGGHVGLYIGNGMMVHGFTEGEPVQINAVADWGPIAAVRFW